MIKKSKFIKPDRIYKLGSFSLAQYGNDVIFSNNMTEEENTNAIKQLEQEYQKQKQEIDSLIKLIREEISNVDPIVLLIYLRDNALLVTIGKVSEIDYDADECTDLRALEYAICVLMGSENIYEKKVSIEFEEYEKILKNIKKLYNKYVSFAFLLIADMKNKGELEEKINYVTDNFLYSNVRGVRFTQYHNEHLNCLLLKQEDLIKKAFGISVSDIINGLDNLEYSISQGQADCYSEIVDLKDNDINLENINFNNIKFNKNSSNVMLSILNLRIALYNNVEFVTEWPKIFIDFLSYSINEANYYNGEFGGWPNIEMPIHKKPFIKIDEYSYCFDYYSLFDNIYRTIQKAVVQILPNSAAQWKDNQQIASENMVADIFKKLFPNCHLYINNYYPHNNSKIDRNENDIILTYNDVLIVAEIKAGSFTYTSAIKDYNAHEKSLKDLVNKPGNQCMRTMNYINSADDVTFFDGKNNEKFYIKKSSYNKFYNFCITVDNFNAIAAKAEKVSQINIGNKIIVISIDDLRIYRDYFENPFFFLHFLEQRCLATEIKIIDFSDELDHLAAYLEHNLYYLKAKDYELKGITKFTLYGYRKELEEFFIKSIKDKQIKKPKINLPFYLQKLLIALTNSSNKYIRELFSGILDYDDPSRNKMNELIKSSIEKTKTGKICPILLTGIMSVCIFIYTNINDINYQEERKHVFANMLNSNIPNIYSISILINNEEDFLIMNCDKHHISGIPNDDKNDLERLGQELLKQRINNLKMQGKKIGRNDKCPCGSGKKYKHCCINKIIN